MNLSVGQVWVGPDGVERTITYLGADNNTMSYTAGSELRFYWTVNDFKIYHNKGGFLKNGKPIKLNKRHLKGL